MKSKFFQLISLGVLFFQSFDAYATQMKKIPSVFHIPEIDKDAKVAQKDFNTSNFLDYIKMANEFFKANNCNEYDNDGYREPNSMYESYHYDIKLLKKLGNTFLYKRHISSPDKIIAVDISFPSIRKAYLKEIDSGCEMDKFFLNYDLEKDTFSPNSCAAKKSKAKGQLLPRGKKAISRAAKKSKAKRQLLPGEKKAIEEFLRLNESLDSETPSTGGDTAASVTAGTATSSTTFDTAKRKRALWNLYKILRASDKFYQKIASEDGSLKIKDKVRSNLVDFVIELLFDTSELEGAKKYPVDAFKKDLNGMISTASGFQRIMSLVALGLESCKNQKNVIKIKIFETDESAFVRDGNVYMDESNAETLFHELGHVLHRKLGINLPYKEDAFINFSIINSPDLDLVDRAFPLLRNDSIKYFIDEIKKALMPNGEPFSISEKLKTSLEKSLKQIARRAIILGFGKILFGDVDLSKNKDALSVDNRLENGDINFIAKCVYLDAVVLPSASQTEEDSYRKGVNRPWNTFEELLTMQGLVFFLMNGELFAIEDRQEDQILKSRKDRLENTEQVQHKDNITAENKHYRYHSGVIRMAQKDIREKLKEIFGVEGEIPKLDDKYFKPLKEKYSYYDCKDGDDALKKIEEYRQGVDEFIANDARSKLDNIKLDKYSLFEYEGDEGSAKLKQDLKDNKVFTSRLGYNRELFVKIFEDMKSCDDIVNLMRTLGNESYLMKYVLKSLIGTKDGVCKIEDIFKLANNKKVYIDPSILLDVYLDETNVEYEVYDDWWEPSQDEAEVFAKAEFHTSFRRVFAKEYLKRCHEDETSSTSNRESFWRSIYTSFLLSGNEFWDDEFEDIVCDLFVDESENLDLSRFLAFTYLEDIVTEDIAITWMTPVLREKGERLLNLIKFKDTVEDKKVGDDTALRLIRLIAESHGDVLWNLLCYFDKHLHIDQLEFEDLCKLVVEKGKPDPTITLEEFKTLFEHVFKMNDKDNRLLEKFKELIDSNKTVENVNEIYYDLMENTLSSYFSRSEYGRSTEDYKLFDRMDMLNAIKPEIEKGFSKQYERVSQLWWPYLTYAARVGSVERLEKMFIDNVDKLPKLCEKEYSKLSVIEDCLKNRSSDKLTSVLRSVLENTVENGDVKGLLCSYLQYIVNNKYKDEQLEKLFVEHKDKLSNAVLSTDLFYNVRCLENYLQNGSSNDLKKVLRSILKNTVESGNVKETLCHYLGYIKNNKYEDEQLEKLFVEHKNKLSGATLPAYYLDVVENYLQNGSLYDLKKVLRSILKNTVESGNAIDLLHSYLKYIEDGKPEDEQLERLFVEHKNKLFVEHKNELFVEHKLFAEHKNELFAATLPIYLEDRRRYLMNYLQSGSSEELKEVLRYMISVSDSWR